MEGLIPARTIRGSKRDAVDSTFLLKYARRMEMQSRWLAVTHGLIGAVIGFGLGSAALAVRGLVNAFTSTGINLANLLGQQPAPAQTEAFVWLYLPWISASVMAVIWGGRGAMRSDDMRFQAQMALHLLRLQELVKEQNDG